MKLKQLRKKTDPPTASGIYWGRYKDHSVGWWRTDYIIIPIQVWIMHNGNSRLYFIARGRPMYDALDQFDWFGPVDEIEEVKK